MSENRDGGPAFPLENPRMLENGELFNQYPGLTKRDYIAIHVLSGLVVSESHIPSRAATARIAYEFADAMLIERERT